MFIKGDSMEPKLSNGDLVFVDKGAVECGFKDGIWLFLLRGTVMVKQLQITGLEQLEVVSANPAYRSFETAGVVWQILSTV